MIRLLFHMTQLRRGGGIESQLISWMRAVDRRRYSVSLSLAYRTADLDAVFRPRIPDDVSLHILGPEPWLSEGRRRKLEGRLGLAGLFREEVLMPPVRKRVFRRRVEAIAAAHDVVVDFDMSLGRFARPPGKPLVGVSHFSLAQRLSGHRGKLRTAARYFPRYDAIVALCDAMREEGRALFPALSDRFRTVYPGFDETEIAERAAAAAAEGGPPVPAGPYVVSVARLDETQKDFQTLLSAFADLVRDPAIVESLVIVGDGRHRAELASLARTLGIAARVTFVGFTPNPLPYVAGARLVVLSSRYEGMPTVLIEGLMLGGILVSTDCPTGPREILDGGRAGLLVPVRDPSALSAAMRRALTDDALRASIAARARAHAPTFAREAFRERFDALVASLAPAAR